MNWSDSSAFVASRQMHLPSCTETSQHCTAPISPDVVLTKFFWASQFLNPQLDFGFEHRDIVGQRSK